MDKMDFKVSFPVPQPRQQQLNIYCIKQIQGWTTQLYGRNDNESTPVITTVDDEDEKVASPFLFSFFKNKGDAKQICLQESTTALLKMVVSTLWSTLGPYSRRRPKQLFVLL